MLIDALLKSLRTRRGVKGKRLGSLPHYLKRLALTMGDTRVAKHLNIDPADLTRAIKSKRQQLTWFDPDHAEPAALWTVKDGKAELSKGTPIGKADDQPASKSIMEFDCTITTARRDRDGDVLDPKGAILDPKMPLLWQHVPFQPIGCMVRALDQSEERVAGRFMIADTALGRDAAVLIETGCLRISHGFAPIEYNPLKDDAGKDLGGWKITKYAVMETSVVSIPSNVDAEIEAFSRGKLHHPLVKSFYKMLKDKRPKIVKAFDSAGGKFEFTLNIAGIEALSGKAATAAAAKSVADSKKGKKADDDAADDEEDDDATGSPTDAGKADDADKSDTDTGKADGGEDGDADGTEDSQADGGEKDAVGLGDMLAGITDMAGDESLPKEAQRRLNVVAGLLEDIGGSIDGSFDKITDAAKNRDLAGMLAGVGEVVEACVGNLASASEEIERIAGIADMPEGSVDAIREYGAGLGRIVEAVRTMTGKADDDGGDPNDPADDDDGKDGYDPADPDNDDDDKADSELEDDKTDSELEDGKGGDGSDLDDDKADSEVEDDKEPSDVDDGKDADPDDDDEMGGEDNAGVSGRENPGVNGGGSRGGKPARGKVARDVDAMLDRLAGAKLAGKLTPKQKAELARLSGKKTTDGRAGRSGRRTR